jgi:hypothetical protein
MPETPAPRVFISYSHDDPAHCDRVLALADRLRADGIDALIDQYIQAPPEGWPAWCAAQIDTADFVLMVCTETYFRRVSGKEEAGAGHGWRWEGRLINQYLYDAGSASAKFIPVLLADGSDAHVPLPVKGGTIYRVETPEGYEPLLRLLSDQPLTPMPPLGIPRPLPPRDRRAGGGREEPSSASAASPPSHPDLSLLYRTVNLLPFGSVGRWLDLASEVIKTRPATQAKPKPGPGGILWNPPDKMRMARPERIEVRIGDADVAVDKLREGLRGRGTPRIDTLEITPLMRVALTADPKDFSIQVLSTQDQLVRPGSVARWDFDVAAQRSGLHRLRLLASMRVKAEGKDEVVDLPSYESEVRVSVAPIHAVGKFCGKNWQWIAGTVAIPLLVWAAKSTGVGSAVLKNLSGWFTSR